LYIQVHLLLKSIEIVDEFTTVSHAKIQVTIEKKNKANKSALIT